MPPTNPAVISWKHTKKEATESLNQTLTELLTCLIYDILLR